jgi:hypothetical protein
MRISKVTRLAIAGTALAGALAAGGAAYANAAGDGNDGDLVVRIQSTEDTHDCPWKNGQEAQPETDL